MVVAIVAQFIKIENINIKKIGNNLTFNVPKSNLLLLFLSLHFSYKL